MENVNLKKGTVLVSGVGASNGLGAAVARKFAEGGYPVVIAGRSEEKLKNTLNELIDAGATAIMRVTDVTDAKSVLKLIEETESTGPIEVAVHNAGGNNWAPFLEVTEESFTTHWREHTLGSFLLAQSVLPHFLKRSQGTLIFTGASGSLRGKAKFAPFSAAKGGVRNLAQSLSREFGPKNIHVGHVIVDGGIDGERLNRRAPNLKAERGDDGMLHIDAIAEAYWMLHHQHRSAWTLELDLRPWSENF
ncbi:MAG: SDR family NAD(P)-dependent oxidoreductase [Burkholderiales bacterium]|nr:SDR family NAD(P)-dependent oxidoreductase [Burkholderiales bacterium]OUT78527.1 MAG: glucose 1-dehydrogenase [Betaproteobacteria bacterium TMED22]|tara:strand:- start:26559 stop:27302 length:744 start_codon:yes stop_codon:yes gene_type:complete